MTEETTEETVREKIERSLKENPDPYVRKFLDNSDAYLKEWDRAQKLREKEIEEREPVSVFEEEHQTNQDQKVTQSNSKNICDRCGREIPNINKDKEFPSLEVWERERIEKYLSSGLSIRSTVKACSSDNFSTSIGTVHAIQKKMKQSV